MDALAAAAEAAAVPVTWAVAVENIPDALPLTKVAPVLMGITGDSGLQGYWAALEERKITDMAWLKKVVRSVMMELQREHIALATLKSLARLMVPGGEFKWPQVAGAEKKRKAGGNGNNKPKLTLEQQLAQEGVGPLDPSTFRFSAKVFERVPKKGEAVCLNPYQTTLFDNMMCAMDKVRAACASREPPCLPACLPACLPCPLCGSTALGGGRTAGEGA